jgi:hypothetical protein
MRRRRERPVGALIAAAVFHVVALVVLANVFQVPAFNIFRAPPRERNEQRVTFLTPRPVEERAPVPLPVAPKPPETSVTDTGRAVAVPVPIPTVAPPTSIPTGVAQTRGDSAGRDSIGARTTNPIAGLLPGKPDARFLGPIGPPRIPDVPVRAERFSPDSAARSWVAAYWDSVAQAQRAAQPNLDWTVKRGDSKYGLDPAFIYFGKFKLPTALLALLPINTMANPTVSERNRALDYMRRDIMFHASRATNSEDFNAAIRRIRERVERERAARIKAEADAKKPAGGSASRTRPPEG